MIEEKDLHQPILQRQSCRRGIIRVGMDELSEFKLTIDQVDTQGELRAKGMFAAIHKRLLLPPSYTIIAIFCEYMRGTWAILVESDNLPEAEPNVELPEVKLHYYQHTDGTEKLIDIQVVQYRSGLSLKERLTAVL